MNRKRGPPKNHEDFVAEEGEDEYDDETNTEGGSIANRLILSRSKQSNLKKGQVRAADTTARKQSRFIVVSQIIFIIIFLYIYNTYFLNVTLNCRVLQSPEQTADLRDVDSSSRKQSR